MTTIQCCITKTFHFELFDKDKNILLKLTIIFLILGPTNRGVRKNGP